MHKCLYIIGGFDGHNYFNTVRKFNVATNEWTQVPWNSTRLDTIIRQVIFQEPSMFNKRCYVSVAKLGDKIYALGGMDGEHRYRDIHSVKVLR